ncbi:response regulator [Chloroflexota bacterium]
MDRIRILVVDDQAIVRRGVIEMLASREEFEVLGEARNGLEAIEKIREFVPDVVVMDLMMPECTGLEATQAIQTEMPQVNILVLTVSDKESDLFDAIKFGAKGYLLKNVEAEELVQAIIHTARGGVTISPYMAAMLINEFQERKEPEPEVSSLSSREEQVLQLVAQGAANKEIAKTLFISDNTVKTHLRNIMEKLHFANRSQAAAYAARRGLVRREED